MLAKNWPLWAADDLYARAAAMRAGTPVPPAAATDDGDKPVGDAIEKLWLAAFLWHRADYDTISGDVQMADAIDTLTEACEELEALGVAPPAGAGDRPKPKRAKR